MSVKFPSSVKKIQDSILNPNLNITITDSDLKKFLSLSVNSTQIIYLIAALSKKKISANDVMVNVIPSIERMDNILIIALALRYGANPDIYILDESQQENHLLVYIYSILSSKNIDRIIIEYIVCLILVHNPDLNSIASDNSEQTVIEWLRQYGYDKLTIANNESIENVIDNYQLLPETILSKIAVYLDRTDLLYSQVEIKMLFECHSSNILREKINTVNISHFLGSLSLAIESIYLTGFEILLQYGLMPDYSLINYLLLRLEFFIQYDQIIPYIQTEEMLITAIKFGYLIDMYQYNMLIHINPKTSEKAEKAFSYPIWRRKIESEDSNYETNRISYFMASDNSNIWNLNPDQLKKAVYRSNQEKLELYSTFVREYLDLEKGPRTICVARSTNDQTSLSHVSYQTPEGTKYVTSNMYRDIMKSKIDPYNGEKLEDIVVKRISQRERILRYLDSYPVNIAYNNVVKMTEGTVISNQETENYMLKFEMLCFIHGLSRSEFKNKTPGELETILGSYITLPISNFTQGHAYASFVRIILEVAKDQPDISRLIFRSYEKRKEETGKTIKISGSLDFSHNEVKCPLKPSSPIRIPSN